MITIEYDRMGLSVSDFNLESFGSLIKSKVNEDYVIQVSSSIALLYVRVMVKRKEIHPENICFLINRQKVFLTEQGRMKNWPESEVSKFDELLGELIS